MIRSLQDSLADAGCGSTIQKESEGGRVRGYRARSDREKIQALTEMG